MESEGTACVQVVCGHMVVQNLGRDVYFDYRLTTTNWNLDVLMTGMLVEWDLECEILSHSHLGL